MDSMKEAALEYAQKGWAIFPCKADKTPYTAHGVMDATTKVEKVEEWWAKWPKANIGLNVGMMGWMVIDLDPGHDLEVLEKNVGPLPDTQLLARTPRGGEHRFFDLADGEKVKASASKLAPHVDVRSFHSYVLLAPSKTSDGIYEWERQGEPAYRTDAMLRAANVAKEKHEDRDTWIIDADIEENISKAAKWLREEADIAIKGDGGNQKTYDTAAMMKSYGLSEGVAFETLWEHWCPRCSPPWDESGADDLETIIRNAYTYNTSPPGNVTPAYKTAFKARLFNAVATQVSADGIEHEWKSGHFRAVDREGMRSIRPPSWLIKNFLPQEAYAILFGAPGTFKTFVALDVALSIATGNGLGPTANWPEIANPGKVLFAAGEGRASLTKRVKAWEKTHFDGNTASRFILIDPVPLITEEVEPFIEAALAASPEGYTLTVIDTVGRSMQGVNENAQENASAFTSLVQHIQYALGSTVLALHHTGHGAADRARGSSVFGADADTLIRLDRKEKSYNVSMSMVKQKDGVEWANPRRVQLSEVSVSAEEVSLVATKSEGDKKAVDITNAKAVAKAEENLAVLAVIEKAVLDYLKLYPAKLFTMAGLGEDIACEDNIHLSGQTLSKFQLKTLREDSERRVARCWNRATRRWSWKD